MLKIEVDLILKNGKYLDVKTREFKEGDIAIRDGKIIGINGSYSAKEEKDIEGKFIVPGFIDGHIHLESSVISPEDFAKIASLHGTTAVVTDPHEIANVCGEDGINYMMQKTKKLPVSVYFMIPSCVPATEFDESAAKLNNIDVANCFEIDNERILGLAEMMNYPGVLVEDPDVIQKIAQTYELGKRVDGHAPGLTGENLKKYIATGIQSDHECSNIQEAIEKINVAREFGQIFYVMIRQGTAAKNLEALAELINMPEYRDNVMFATDDKHPEELKCEGHIDSIIRKSIDLGVKPEDAYVTATYNAAKYFKLEDLGRIEEGCNADLTILDDIVKVKINSVYKNGNEMRQETLLNWPRNKVEGDLEQRVRNSINMREVTTSDISCKGIPKQVIGLVPGEIITTDEGISDDYDLSNDIIKAVVIEPHKGTMHTGIAYLKGMGLKKGAIGTTVAHDSHYMILAGTNDRDIIVAANRLANMQGGKIYVEDGEEKTSLALPIANLMTDESPKEVIKKMEELKEYAKVNKGIDAFMNLSFVSLPVIGDVRLLPSGAFNVKEWRVITQQELDQSWKQKNGNTQSDEGER
ncbi:MAG: adenine deaminase [Clostridia bacterium]|nr:adenine deaminase [Clostridia bacterium]